MSVGTRVFDGSRPVAAEVSARAKATGRLVFVDNIRVLLTILVILFHLMITYAGTGDWYYTEDRQDLITGALGAWFLAVNQAYFMGLFLLISAYFVPGSYDRKGAGRFLKDRLIRLGIPLALYSWIIRPMLVYLDPVKSPSPRPPFSDFLTGHYFVDQAILGSGPLWFIEILLLFSALYALWRLLARPRSTAASAVESRFPSSGRIALTALLMGIAGFLVRLGLPMGWNLEVLNLQFPFFVQYIVLFVLGLIAYRRNWLLGLSDRVGRLWLGIAGGPDPALLAPAAGWWRHRPGVRCVRRWLALAGPGLCAVGVLPLPGDVHRPDLPVPTPWGSPGQDDAVPLAQCVHSLPDPRSADRHAGLRRP